MCHLTLVFLQMLHKHDKGQSDQFWSHGKICYAINFLLFPLSVLGSTLPGPLSVPMTLTSIFSNDSGRDINRCFSRTCGLNAVLVCRGSHSTKRQYHGQEKHKCIKNVKVSMQKSGIRISFKVK